VSGSALFLEAGSGTAIKSLLKSGALEAKNGAVEGRGWLIKGREGGSIN